VTSEHANEIIANLERAEQSIQAARQLASGGYYDFAASRARLNSFPPSHPQQKTLRLPECFSFPSTT
jgi:hypothetical protein